MTQIQTQENYYEERKQKVLQKSQRNKDRLIIDTSRLFQVFQAEQTELQKEFDELEGRAKKIQEKKKVKSKKK